MTLSTDVHVLDPVDVGELFVECQRILGTFDEQGRGPERQMWTERPGEFGNKLGQNLPAILSVYRGVDGPYCTAEESAACGDDCEEDCDGKYHERACWAKANLDTAYGYRSAHGGCGDLHAKIIFALAPWLTERGIRFSWQNESTGDVYDGLTGLDTLCSSGREAAEWLKSIWPAILADAAAPTHGGTR